METAKRVLIVDDEKEIRRALEMGLRPRGYELLFAESGENALEQVALHRLGDRARG